MIPNEGGDSLFWQDEHVTELMDLLFEALENTKYIHCQLLQTTICQNLDRILKRFTTKCIDKQKWIDLLKKILEHSPRPQLKFSAKQAIENLESS